MLKRSPTAHPRRLWIALTILAVAALVGTFLMLVRSGGMTNHLDFARRVATLLLTYDAGTDFAARNAELLRAAAPTPYGNPT
jgi:hypothetical protein